MNCTLCKYRVQIVGFEQQVGEPQQAHHLQVRGLLEKVGATAAIPTPAKPGFTPYEPHPIEAESFRIIAAGLDWSVFPAAHLTALQRLVHTSGDFNAVDDIYFSPGAIETGIRALLRCKRVVADVTMVQTGLKRALLEQLGIETWCGVHDRETFLMAQAQGITRSAAGIRRAWEKFDNDIILAIGDAPTAIAEATRLIREHGWRPQLVIGLPVGFVGTRESKDDLRRCMQVHFIDIQNAAMRGRQQARLKSPLRALQRALQIERAEYPVFGRPQRQRDERHRTRLHHDSRAAADLAVPARYTGQAVECATGNAFAWQRYLASRQTPVKRTYGAQHAGQHRAQGCGDR
jgi:precorrin isomerase